MAVCSGCRRQPEASAYLQVSADGSNWKTLDVFDPGDSDSGNRDRTYEVSSWISDRFGVRFIATGEFIGSFYLDNVEIVGIVDTGGTATTTIESTTTSTSVATTTTTTRPTTTTSRATTTTEATATTATTATTEGGTTTTTVPETTTTTGAVAVVLDVDPPEGSGLREPTTGLQFDHAAGMGGSMDMMDKPEVLGIEIGADYSMAVELVESSWIWMIGLLVVVATAIVTGLDRRTNRIERTEP